MNLFPLEPGLLSYYHEMKSTAARKTVGPGAAGVGAKVVGAEGAGAEAGGTTSAGLDQASQPGPSRLLGAAPEAIFDLRRVPYPAEFSSAARNVVLACLRIRPDEKVTLIIDDASLQVAASIAAELEKVGCEWHAFILEALAARPLVAMPGAVLEDLETSQASIFAVTNQPNELHARIEMSDVVSRRRMRHAHMAGITGEIMMESMSADVDQVERVSEALLERLRGATYLRAITAAGTDIHAQLTPFHRWFKTTGILTSGLWANLPGGACFTAPEEVNGVYVVDGLAGGVLAERYGILSSGPVSIDIENNRIARVRSSNKHLERDLWDLTHADRNSDRVGEISLGTNLGVQRVIGNLLQDSKLPGVHLAFGDPHGAQTGADWKSSTHLDVVGTGFTVWLGNADGEEQIMDAGEFTLEV